jgi:hypothetical protein
VRCRVFNKHMVVLATPELCKRVLQTNISNYVKGRLAWCAVRYALASWPWLIVQDSQPGPRGLYSADVGFSYKPFLSILGTGLVTSEGALWKKQRLLISKAFRCVLPLCLCLAAVVGDRNHSSWPSGCGQPVRAAVPFQHISHEGFWPVRVPLTHARMLCVCVCV